MSAEAPAGTEPSSGYSAEAIKAHPAFIASRRALRPSEEYRTPTAGEWDAFLGHFERRKLSVGICARAFGTACIHEHACVHCSMLRPDPAQRARLALDAEKTRQRTIDLGMPRFSNLAGRTGSSPQPGFSAR